MPKIVSKIDWKPVEQVKEQELHLVKEVNSSILHKLEVHERRLVYYYMKCITVIKSVVA